MALNQFLVIKQDILQDKNLTSTDKLILAYIYGFLNSGNPFYSSTKEISRFLGISTRQVVRSINKLSEVGYIHIRHSKDEDIPGNDIRVIEKSVKYQQTMLKLEGIINSFKAK